MQDVIIVSSMIILLLLSFVVAGSVYGQTTTDQSLDTFLDCYSKNAANFMLSNMFLPITIDLTDPNIKKLISSMCNFYHEKTGIWVDLSQDRDIMEPFDQEFWNQYPINELPKDLMEFWKEQSIYNNNNN